MTKSKVSKKKASKGGGSAYVVNYNAPPQQQVTLSDLLDDVVIPADGSGQKPGTVEIPMATFLDLLKKGVRQDPAPASVLVESVELHARVQEDVVVVEAQYVVVVVESGWSQVQLLPETVAVKEATLVREDLSRSSESGGDDEKDKASWLGVVDDSYSLVTNNPGRYTVVLDCVAPFETARKSGFVLTRLPKALRNVVFVKVPGDVLVTATPSLDLEHGTTTEPEGAGTLTTLRCVFPPSRRLSVQWSQRVELETEEEEELGEEEQMIVTVEQSVLHSIGEGMLKSNAEFTYKIAHGNVTSLVVAIDPNVRILKVTGSAIKKWDIVTREDIGEEKRRVLKVLLDYGVENSYVLNVGCETEMAGTTCQVQVPTFQSLQVDREKGYFGVEARTNVEIDETHRSGVGKLSVDELPYSVRKFADNPILFGYKFLVAGYEVALDVKKHDDVDVLTTIIDDAWLDATLSAEGSMMCKYVMNVRNTQTQYLRVELPEAAGHGSDIWSTVVAGNAVKPARDKESGKLMIPLEKSSTSRSGGHSFTLEFVYIVRMPAMGSGGKLDFAFCSVDIPINHLYVSVFLPKEYKYGEFSGNIREVTRLSKGRPQEGGAPGGGGGGGGGRGRQNRVPQMQMQQQVLSNVMMERAESICFDEAEEEEEQYMLNDDDMVTSGIMFSRKKASGVAPVRVGVVRVGTPFYFEKTIVQGGGQELQVAYSKIDKGYFQKRKLGWCTVL